MQTSTKQPVTLADLSFEDSNTVLTAKNGQVCHYSRVISAMRAHGLVTDIFRLGARRGKERRSPRMASAKLTTRALELQQELLAALPTS